MPEAESWDEFSERLRDLETRELKPDIISPYLALPGLRGFWPFSSFGSTGSVLDMSGQGRTLGYVGNPTHNYDGFVPYLDMDGVGDYLARLDEAALDIVGNEAYVGAAVRGLTIGGWFSPNALGGGNEGLFGKYNSTTNNRSYLLLLLAAPGSQPWFAVSTNGIASVNVTSTVSLVAGEWYHIVGRFDPSTEIAVFVNGVKTVNTTAIPATIFSGNANLEAGSFAAGSFNYNGRMSQLFLCAERHDDSIIQANFEQTRGAMLV